MMRLHPTRIHVLTASILLTLFLILFSCSTDTDILRDANLSDSVEDIDNTDEEEDTTEEEASENTEEDPTEEDPTEEESSMEEGFESRITSFFPIYDAYVENGIGINKDLMRLDTDHRISYLQFDLSAIDSIGGYITDVNLQFTINSDGGNGEIIIYKGLDSDWSEENIGESNAPDTDIELGRINKDYTVGDTESVLLSASDLIPEKFTLIMDHIQGNDLAIASKEHATENIPELQVTYNAPEDAEEIESIAPDVPNNDDDSGENQAPNATATANIIGGKAPLEVKFRGADSTDDKMITKYFWNFKDGNTSTQKNPTHTFTSGGTFEVLLRVEDQEGLKDTDIITIEVAGTTNEEPIAKVSATPVEGTVPLEVSFTGSNSTDDKEIVKYSWNFKDGNSSSEADPTHTFTEAGTYKVLLTVEDEEGLKGTKTITITASSASNEAPNAVANANPISGEAPLTVNFDGSNSTDDNGVVSHQWDFDGNGSSSAKKPTRTFDDPGVYVVTLTVQDAQGIEDTDTVTITVEEPASGGGGSNGNYPPGAVLASSFGYNSSNATDALKDAILSNNNFIVVDKKSNDWIIEPTRLPDVSNKTIIFEQGVVVRSKSGAFPDQNDVLLNFVRANNVVIEGYGATLKMNKSEYNNGEWRHALKIDSSNDVEVRGFTIKDSGGDGIYLGNGGQGFSKNITIEDIVSTNNLRQGMSIISAENVWVRRCEFRNTKGKSPEAGVDLEPNDQSDRLVNINFEDCKFINNDSYGFNVGVYNLTSSSRDISVYVRDSYFKNNSLSPNEAHKLNTEIHINDGNQTNPVDGEVVFEGITFDGSGNRVLFSKKSFTAFHVTFRNCDARNVITNINDPVIQLEGRELTKKLGGFTFDNFYIEYDRNQPFFQASAPAGTTFKNVNGTFTIKEPNDNPPKFLNGAKLSSAVNVNINYTHIN